MIQNRLLITQMIWMIFMKTLKNKSRNSLLEAGAIFQRKNEKKKIVFDDMIADLLSNEKLNPIVTELFIGGRKLNNSLVPKKLD